MLQARIARSVGVSYWHGGHQLDAAGTWTVVLHGGLFVDERDHDLAGVGPLLRAHQHVVTIEDAGVHHAVAADAQREET